MTHLHSNKGYAGYLIKYTLSILTFLFFCVVDAVAKNVNELHTRSINAVVFDLSNQPQNHLIPAYSSNDQKLYTDTNESGIGGTGLDQMDLSPRFQNF